MITTEHGEFDLIKNFKDAFDLETFNKRYLDIFSKYPYIVGDYSAGLLRLKGFTKSEGKNNYNYIPDYLLESCVYGCPYFILKSEKASKNNF